MYQDTKVYTVNIWRDEIRSTTDKYNINIDVNTSQFISYIRGKQLSFNEIYLDHFRTPTHYGCEKFTNDFMSNIVKMVEMGALIPLNKDNPARVYLPFTPSFSIWHIVIMTSEEIL